MTIQAAPPATHRFGLRDFAIVVVMNVLWGLNIIAVKMAVTEIAPMTAGSLRQVIVFAVCASWFRLVPGRTATLALLGLLSGGIFYLVINLSLSVATNIGALAIAGQLGVPFALLLAIVVFRERIHWPRMLGIGLSILGVVLLVFDPSAAREGAGLALTARERAEAVEASRDRRGKAQLALAVGGHRPEQRRRSLMGAVGAPQTLDRAIGAPARFEQEMRALLLVLGIKARMV